MDEVMVTSSSIADVAEEMLDECEPVFPQTRESWGNGDVVPEGARARQYAAIHLCVPDSGVVWLDKMIRKSLRYKIAASVIPGLMCAQDITRTDRPGSFVSKAIEYAKVCVPDVDE